MTASAKKLIIVVVVAFVLYYVVQNPDRAAVVANDALTWSLSLLKTVADSVIGFLNSFMK